MRANTAKKFSMVKSDKAETKVEPKVKPSLIEEIRAAEAETTAEAEVEAKGEDVAAADAPANGETTEAPVEPVAAPAATGYVIEDNIPMPAAQGGGGKAKYPWAELSVGQSFFIADGKIKTAYTMASHAGKKLSKSFASRPVEGGVRIWRTA